MNNILNICGLKIKKIRTGTTGKIIYYELVHNNYIDELINFKIKNNIKIHDLSKIFKCSTHDLDKLNLQSFLVKVQNTHLTNYIKNYYDNRNMPLVNFPKNNIYI